MNHTIEIVDEQIIVISEGIQGPPGPSVDGGGGGLAAYVAATALGGHRAVILDTAGHAAYADNADLTHLRRVIGITTGAADQGSAVTVVGNGTVNEPSWNWNVNLPVYLGSNGLLTQTVPTAPGAKFLTVVGFPISNTSLFVNVREPFILS